MWVVYHQKQLATDGESHQAQRHKPPSSFGDMESQKGKDGKYDGEPWYDTAMHTQEQWVHVDVAAQQETVKKQTLDDDDGDGEDGSMMMPNTRAVVLLARKAGVEIWLMGKRGIGRYCHHRGHLSQAGDGYLWGSQETHHGRIDWERRTMRETGWDERELPVLG